MYLHVGAGARRLPEQLWLLWSLALLVSALGASVALGAKERLAVLPLNGTDTSGVTEGLRKELEAGGRFKVETGAQTVSLIESARDLGLDCGPGDVKCLVKLGVLGELDSLLAPWITADDKGALLELVLIDVAEERSAFCRLAPMK